MTNVCYSRSQDIFDPVKARPVAILGCGSIGSFAAETLAKMGFQTFHLYDGDIVGEENIGCQRFGHKHVGMTKVDALKEILISTAPVEEKNIHAHYEFVEGATRLLNISTVVGVDNMLARQNIWKKLQGKVPLIIDGRIGGQVVRVFGVMNDYAYNEYYASHLYNDEDAVDLPCTQRNVCYVANIVQGIIGRMMRNFLEKGKVEKEIGIDVESFINYVKE